MKIKSFTKYFRKYLPRSIWNNSRYLAWTNWLQYHMPRLTSKQKYSIQMLFA